MKVYVEIDEFYPYYWLIPATEKAEAEAERDLPGYFDKYTPDEVPDEIVEEYLAAHDALRAARRRLRVALYGQAAS